MSCDYDDLFQTAWLKILEIPEPKIIDIHSKGYLRYYIYRIIGSIVYHDRKKTIHVELTEDICIYDNIESKLDLDNVNKVLDKMHWYDKKLFEVYLHEGSYRKVEKATTIGYNMVKKTVQKVRKKLNGIERNT